ncbi:MAG TPA: hypothetical protein DCL15_03500 [Chloroflexi bacterium]|nr:hypothetical protein [Chloroflexota bacterium]HHW87124.1 hypothetical protein [Chloroflexota bacterium]
MSVILALTQAHETIWALGPEGLFIVADGALTAQPQPDAQPTCCYHDGERLFVGGATHGLAYTTPDGGWQASWLDGVTAPVVCLAADPEHQHSGVLLAGTAGGGVLRSINHGRHWSVCNFGLFDFEVLSLAWAPVQPAGMWPPVQVAFAGALGGVYRSPNGGRGWKQVAVTPAPVLTLAVAPDFHVGGAVLAGTEGGGLWRSDDGGYTFAPVAGAPEVVNALLALPGGGWLLSDAERIWRSADATAWTPLDLPPALTFLATERGVLAGGMDGVFWVG